MLRGVVGGEGVETGERYREGGTVGGRQEATGRRGLWQREQTDSGERNGGGEKGRERDMQLRDRGVM